MKQKLLFLFLYIGFQSSFAQDSFLLKGKIVSQSSSLQDIHVQNKTQKTGTFSDEYGNFKLTVSVQDTLFITAIFIKPVTYSISEKDKTKEMVYIPVVNNVSNLDEVTIIEYTSITPEKLGIIPYGIKLKTPAERKLAAANSGFLEPFLNAITGRTKYLKKLLEIERKEFLMEEIQLDYGKQFITERLKIPEDYVSGFYFYLVEQPDFVAVYKSKNIPKTEFAIIEKAKLYLEIITENKSDE